MATMMAEAMVSLGFGERSIRELDSVKVPGFLKVETLARWTYEFLRCVMTASGRRDNVVHDWLNPILSGSREELKRMSMATVPSAFTTLDAKLATAV